MTTEKFLDREREAKLSVIRAEYEQEKRLLTLPIVTQGMIRKAEAYRTVLDTAGGKNAEPEKIEASLTYLYEEYAYFDTCLALSENMEWAAEYQEREELIGFMIGILEREPTVRTPSSNENGSTIGSHATLTRMAQA